MPHTVLGLMAESMEFPVPDRQANLARVIRQYRDYPVSYREETARRREPVEWPSLNLKQRMQNAVRTLAKVMRLDFRFCKNCKEKQRMVKCTIRLEHESRSLIVCGLCRRDSGLDDTELTATKQRRRTNPSPRDID